MRRFHQGRCQNTGSRETKTASIEPLKTHNLPRGPIRGDRCIQDNQTAARLDNLRETLFFPTPHPIAWKSPITTSSGLWVDRSSSCSPKLFTSNLFENSGPENMHVPGRKVYPSQSWCLSTLRRKLYQVLLSLPPIDIPRGMHPRWN